MSSVSGGSVGAMARMMRAFGRLKPGADLHTANSEIQTVAARMEQQYPADYPSSRGLHAGMDGLQEGQKLNYELEQGQRGRVSAVNLQSA